MERPAPEVCCFIKALLETLLAQDPIVLSASDPARPQPVQRAIQWMRQMIDAEPERPLRLEKVAAAAGVTPKHLCRLFQRNVGSGPMTVNRLLRLQLALALLRRSNLTIKQISQRCGFASQFQFSHCFSQVFRHSPTAMRQNIMRGDILPSSPLPPDLMPRIHW
jgi:transcriptional regulator GlxA family with amidase domain